MGIRDRMFLIALGVAAIGSVAPAQAQAQGDPVSELDRIVDQSQGVGPAMDLARRQIAADDLIGAAGTLERLLVDHPEADEALLLHVSLLCRLNDAPGARAELAELGAVSGTEDAWAEVRAACGPVPRPGGRR